MPEQLLSSRPLDAAGQAALPPASPTLTVSVADGLRVLALRHLAGGAAAIDEVLTAHSLPALPGPGACLGDDPWQLWTGPAETLLVTSNGPLADGVLAALRPGCHHLACAVDQSAGSVVFDVRGTGLDDLLSSLLDASAIPGHAGQGTRARFMDISAMILRVGQDRVLLVVDRALGGYVAQWIGHAWHPEVRTISWTT